MATAMVLSMVAGIILLDLVENFAGLVDVRS
jgi:hypothetical protein